MQRRTLLAASAVITLFLASSVTARAETAIKFTLDWRFQGPTAAFIAARDLGYFEEEWLSITIDSGNGSAGAVKRVASGAYQMGFADINALVEFNANNPGQAVKSVMMVYDALPFGLYALALSGIESPEDIAGKILGAPVFDASYKLFPAFAAETGIDAYAVPRVNMDPPLREAMLVRGEVDIISGHYFSSILDLEAKGVAREDITAMLYSDFGMDFYGNAVIAGGDFMAENPDAVAGFNRAVAKGVLYSLENPQEAVEMVAKVDPLIDKELELKRLQLAIDTNIVTEYTQANGFGGVDDDRLASSVEQLALALGLESKPAVADIWRADFLPSAQDRQLP